jgi:hypothetical protein
VIQQNSPTLQSVAQNKNCLQKWANVRPTQSLSISVNRSSSKQLPFAHQEGLRESAGNPPFTPTFSNFLTSLLHRQYIQHMEGKVTLSQDGRSVISLQSQPLYARYSLARRTGRPHSLTRHFWDKNKSLDPAGNRTAIPYSSCPLPSNRRRCQRWQQLELYRLNQKYAKLCV